MIVSINHAFAIFRQRFVGLSYEVWKLLARRLLTDTLKTALASRPRLSR
jgi:hypothetical protein